MKQFADNWAAVACLLLGCAALLVTVLFFHNLRDLFQ